MTITEIKKFPTTFIDAERGNCHESLLRSYQVLEKVKQMLQRGDSKETILEFIDECYNNQP